jgi:hypothetical protein
MKRLDWHSRWSRCSRNGRPEKGLVRRPHVVRRKKGLESVCYERHYRGSDGSGALLMMRVGPSKSACRRRFQTVASGVDQESSS